MIFILVWISGISYKYFEKDFTRKNEILVKVVTVIN